MGNHEFDGRIIVLIIDAKSLNDRTHRIFEQLKHHVVQMRGHIHKLNVARAEHLYLGCLEETIVLFANETCVGNGVHSDLPNIGLDANDTHVVVTRG